MADLAATVITGITALASGAVGKAVVDSWVAGRRQRKAALGERETRLDRALASRAVWIDDSQFHRGRMYRHAADEVRPLPVDPWCPNDKKE